MKQNLGKVDRIIRVVAGLAVLSLFFILEGDARYIGLVGIVFLGTAAVGFCPLYVPLKLNTACRDGQGSCCGGGSCETKE
ncbi:MAG TPA: DUF2892 domain-containing protein [Alphaproteobacteria bacterium]|nr:DUF2892 domain-containing protein [Alphaproteobacteria bacterium]HOO49885.1 DUF2892 domain-containing protein [Alphaproteobacteria bacterium]